MRAFNESILLNNNDYDRNTRTWRVPVLIFRGVRLLRIQVGDTTVDPAKYTLARNIVSFSKTADLQIDSNTKASAIIEISERTAFYRFWVPIICAIIMFLGALSQPVLYHVGVLYQSKALYGFHVHEWGINDRNQFFAKATIYPARSRKWITEDDIKKGRLLLAVREENKCESLSEGEYQFVSGPHPIKIPIESNVQLSSEFLGRIKQEKKYAECVVFLVKSNVTIKTPFEPSIYGDTVIPIYGVKHSCD